MHTVLRKLGSSTNQIMPNRQAPQTRWHSGTEYTDSAEAGEQQTNSGLTDDDSLLGMPLAVMSLRVKPRDETLELCPGAWEGAATSAAASTNNTSRQCDGYVSSVTGGLKRENVKAAAWPNRHKCQQCDQLVTVQRNQPEHSQLSFDAITSHRFVCVASATALSA